MTNPATEPSSASDSAAAAPIYALLSRILLNEIDHDLIATLENEVFLDTLEPIAPGLRLYVSTFDEASAELAAEEFTRLFILPQGVAPRAAAWIDGELETVGARLSYKTQHYIELLGREIDTSVAGKLPLDHLGLLLDLAAVSAGTEQGAAVVRDLIEPWAYRYGDALSRRASCPVYVAAGQLLKELHPQ